MGARHDRQHPAQGICAPCPTSKVDAPADPGPPRPIPAPRPPQPKSMPRPMRMLRPTPKSRLVPSPPSADASRAADEVGRERTPSPPAGSRLAWTCEACGNLNLRTSHHCSRTGCNGRLPHRLRAGDWECHQCGHMNRQWRDRCNWSHCPSNDWECPSCGNYNFGDRRFCNGRDPPCTEPRPHSLR